MMAMLMISVGIFAQSTQLRAFWIQGQGATSNNNPAAFSLFKKLGYNTVMEFVPPPKDSAKWKIPQFVVEPVSRTALVKYIKDQKVKANQAGLSYCPFFNEWGWGDVLPALNERASATVYREADCATGYYGKDVYQTLSKTTGGWGDTSRIICTFDPSLSKITFAYGGAAANGCARVTVNTKACSVHTSATLPDHLINGQCYDVEFVAELTNANLAPGDYLIVYIFREFAHGQKPDPAALPLGKLEYPGNDTRVILEKKYSITLVSQNGYLINNDPNFVTSISIKIRFWTETKLPVGLGHGYDDVFRIDWEVLSKRSAPHSKIVIDNIKIKAVDPADIVTNKAWEQDSHYKSFTIKYPDEIKRETKAVYDVAGAIVENRYFLDPHPPGGTLKIIKGHFPPFNNDCGFGSLVQKPVDPLSPVTDLATIEMLKIIKEGLGNTEPAFFCFNSDELNVFRRDINNIENGLSGTVYNKCSNGAYFGRIIQKHIERYKSVFGTKGKVKTRFIVYGDMILPFANGYYYYAEQNNDGNALSYLKKLHSDKISVALWVYDYMAVPNGDPSMPNEFELKNRSRMEDMIGKVTKNNLGYIAWYATDGRTMDLKSIDSGISTDSKHLQHEIDMARNWCDLTTRIPSGFTGYMYCAWNAMLKANRYNGIYSLAYFGWAKQSARDFPEKWKAISASMRGDNDEPVLDMLVKGVVPWVDTGY
jgi:hypothetical protein